MHKQKTHGYKQFVTTQLSSAVGQLSAAHIKNGIRGFANCKTMGVFYLCKCTCPMDYVGKTKSRFRHKISWRCGKQKRHPNITPRLGETQVE